MINLPPHKSFTKSRRSVQGNSRGWKEESTGLRVTPKIAATTACQQLNLITSVGPGSSQTLTRGACFSLSCVIRVRPFKTLFGVCRLKEAVKLVGGFSV